MHFIYRIALRITAVLLPLMAVWGALFYFTMVDEIRDEADDALEDYSAMIISHILAGEELRRKTMARTIASRCTLWIATMPLRIPT